MVGVFTTRSFTDGLSRDREERPGKSLFRNLDHDAEDVLTLEAVFARGLIDLLAAVELERPPEVQEPRVGSDAGEHANAILLASATRLVLLAPRVEADRLGSVGELELAPRMLVGVDERTARKRTDDGLL